MLNFLILSEESFVMILLRFRLGSGVLKKSKMKSPSLSGLPLPVAACSSPGWQRRHTAGRGWAAPVQLAGVRVQTLGWRGGRGRPREVRGVGGSLTGARQEVLRLEVWREEEKFVSRERKIPGWGWGGETGIVREDGGGGGAAAGARAHQVGVDWERPLLPGVRGGAGYELLLPGEVTARLHLQQQKTQGSLQAWRVSWLGGVDPDMPVLSAYFKIRWLHFVRDGGEQKVESLLQQERSFLPDRGAGRQVSS